MGDSMFYCSRILRDVHEGQPVVFCSHVGCNTVVDLDKLLRFPDGPSSPIPPGSVCRVRICEHSEQDICISYIGPPNGPIDLDSNRPNDSCGNR